ncbi:hypothetical protein Q3G72_020898 [Acer saccharum]|nr:hypothetical protein Q3G72_020898 [Acer saccharum]
MACPGSLALEQAYPDKTSDFADEGTLAHALAAYCLENEDDAAVHVDEAFSYVDHGVEKSAVITVDMACEVQKYLDHVRADLGDDGELFVEQRLPIFTGNHACVPEQFGTSDTVIVRPVARQLVIRDLKYGRGVQVYAERNEQLMLYALGALDEFGLLYEIDEAVLIIDQPRLNHFDEWTVSVTDLRAFEQEALEAGRKALELVDDIGMRNTTTDLRPGEKQCQFCKAKADCPALRDAVLAAVTVDFDVMQDAQEQGTTVLAGLKKDEIVVTMSEAERIVAAAHGVAPKAVDWVECDVADAHFIVKKPTIRPALDNFEERIANLADDDLAVCMAAVDLVEGWCRATRARVERRLLDGYPISGYKLVQGKQGNRAWTDEEEVEKTLKSFRLRNDVMYDAVLISPTSAAKLADQGVIRPKQYEKLKDLIARSDGKPSVAPASDKRPALVIGKVEDQFEALDDDSDPII